MTTDKLLEIISIDTTDGGNDIQYQALFELEDKAVPSESRQKVIDVLKSYIEKHRTHIYHENSVGYCAHCSAIRKCVGLFDTVDFKDNFNWLADLLETEQSNVPSMNLELEVSKMLFRKFSDCPFLQSSPNTRLSDALYQIVEAYTHPRIFYRQGYATVAMAALQALLMLSHYDARILMKKINAMPSTWFRKQLYRRMKKMVQSKDADLCKTIECIKIDKTD